MSQYTGYSAHASLVALSQWMKTHSTWELIESQVKIQQKTIQHSPCDKLKDMLIHILAGGQAVADINQRVRVDKALQLTFGRQACAEQSTISETLNACTAANVMELTEVLRSIYKLHGQGYRHDYVKSYQILDIDLSACLAGKQAEGATKGYFSGHENRRGRQLGRVLASLYGEIVCEKLYPGNIQLERNLLELIDMAEKALELDENRRKHTIIRVDAGGGTDANINALLNRCYSLLLKSKNWQRTCKLVRSVTDWQVLPQLPDHECGWVSQPHEYVKPSRQLAVRWPNQKKGGWCYSVLVFNLEDSLLFELAGRPQPQHYTDLELMATVVDAYDQRGGGVETSYRNSKQGISLNKRNKKSFQAQEMLILLAQLAYNLIHWVQQELALHSPAIASFGTLRMVRDAFQIAGKVELDDQGCLVCITLNRLHKLAKAFQDYWESHCSTSKMSLILGEI